MPDQAISAANNQTRLINPTSLLTLERPGACLPGANAHCLIELHDEDLAIADLTGARGCHDRFDHAVDLFVIDRELQFDLGQEVDHVLGATI